MEEKGNTITILGAGLVGSLLSILLAKKGYQVSLFEKRGDLRKSGIDGGRSINLALSNRGLKALSLAGLDNKVQDMVIPMKGRLMHDVSKELTFQPYGQDGQFINSISRGGLNRLLINEAEEHGVQIYFDSICSEVDLDKNEFTVQTNGTKHRHFSNLIIGADGAFSVLRRSFMKYDRFNYSQEYLTHGYKELSIPPGPNGSFKLDKNALHIWPRGDYMLIALPNTDGSFTCTLFLAFEGETSFAQIEEASNARAFFQDVFPDALELMESFEEEWNTNPTSSLVTVRCYPWVRNQSLLIGDAAHAIVPFYGQGMNCGFEDCLVLYNFLEEHRYDWETTIEAFQHHRKKDADAIADLALRNFIEMRDLVGDENFLLRKKIESRLQQSFPDTWVPLYSMVTFNDNVSYSEALRLGKIQESVMDEVMQMDNMEQDWDSMDLSFIKEKYQAKLDPNQ